MCYAPLSGDNSLFSHPFRDAVGVECVLDGVEERLSLDGRCWHVPLAESIHDFLLAEDVLPLILNVRMGIHHLESLPRNVPWVPPGREEFQRLNHLPEADETDGELLVHVNGQIPRDVLHYDNPDPLHLFAMAGVGDEWIVRLHKNRLDLGLLAVVLGLHGVALCRLAQVHRFPVQQFILIEAAKEILDNLLALLRPLFADETVCDGGEFQNTVVLAFNTFLDQLPQTLAGPLVGKEWRLPPAHLLVKGEQGSIEKFLPPPVNQAMMHVMHDGDDVVSDGVSVNDAVHNPDNRGELGPAPRVLHSLADCGGDALERPVFLNSEEFSHRLGCGLSPLPA